MMCLKCLKVFNKTQDLQLNEYLDHLNNWSVCDDCDNTGMYSHEYYMNNKEHYRQLHKEYKTNLIDSYVANLFADGTSLKAKDIPDNIIDGKRQHIKLKRLLKENKHEC